MQLKARDTASIDEKRLGIAQKAAALFIKQGYLKTTVRQICHECNLSMGGLYYYISSKDDILSLFQEEAFSSLVRFTQQSLSAQNDITPGKLLRCAIGDYPSFIHCAASSHTTWVVGSDTLSHWQDSPPR